MEQSKKELCSTAIAAISCAEFRAGQHVAIRYYCTDRSGQVWYTVAPSAAGLDTSSVCYPENHLTNFVL